MRALSHVQCGKLYATLYLPLLSLSISAEDSGWGEEEGGNAGEWERVLDG